MADPQLQLSWESYQKNICNGLGLLQQRGEFVDMTIAADGHHVKVHQMILSLISPFIKELITSAPCPHPVIFLNKVSYETLQSILEYAYTGEVLVTRERLGEFLEACKSLHIKGLEHDGISSSEDGGLFHVNENVQTAADTAFLRSTGARDIKNITEDVQTAQIPETKQTAIRSGVKRKRVDTSTLDDNETSYDDGFGMDDSHADNNSSDGNYENNDTGITVLDNRPEAKYVTNPGALIQYTLSAQGCIQLVLNRFIYHMRHTRKNKERQWRCQDYNKSRCRAVVITKGNMVLARGCAHNHPFHDKQILKRVQKGNMFTGFSTVETMASIKKKRVTSLKSAQDDDDDDDANE